MGNVDKNMQDGVGKYFGWQMIIRALIMRKDYHLKISSEISEEARMVGTL